MTKFWKITIYDSYQEYGGAEEGGWYFRAGEAARYLPKKFYSRGDALAFCKKIRNKVDAATEETFGRPSVLNAYRRYDMRIWFNGSGPEELPVPRYS